MTGKPPEFYCDRCGNVTVHRPAVIIECPYHYRFPRLKPGSFPNTEAESHFCAAKTAIFLHDGASPYTEVFTNLFEEAWEAIPIRARRKLRNYWRGWKQVPKSRIQLHSSPTILLVDDFGDDIIVWAGVTMAAGHAFMFDAPELLRLPRQNAMSVIGHELGHAYLWATDHPKKREPKETYLREILMKEWRFDNAGTDHLLTKRFDERVATW